MMYKPHRDERYEYLSDLMEFIESNQCHQCLFSKTVSDPSAAALEFPMCEEVEGELLSEASLDFLDDRGNDGVVCMKYVGYEASPEQGRLF